MELPKGEVDSIVYMFKDGRNFVITGEDLRNFDENIKAASVFYGVHGMSFKPVHWMEYEMPELPEPDIEKDP